MSPSPVEISASVIFALAILNSFFGKRFARFPKLHVMAEIESAFGVWALVFLGVFAFWEGPDRLWVYLHGLHFREPLIVMAAMIVAGSPPMLALVERVIIGIAKALPLPTNVAYYVVTLTIGPLLGSFVTEPAAMTVIALLLKKKFVNERHFRSARFLYSTLAVIFVNVSIGGVLTPYAAPPVIMVALSWNWDLPFMLTQFGWRAVLAVFINAILATLFNRETLRAHEDVSGGEVKLPFSLKPALLVGCFLAALIVLGGPQQWWLKDLIPGMQPATLFFASTGLTAILDNAALTYLGTQVPGLSDTLKYVLVAGAVTGGGLTVIANAPNPIGLSTFRSAFGKDGFSPFSLLGYAIPPTLVAIIFFYFF